jgi:O-antigen/teichoic acid export membrane protein
MLVKKQKKKQFKLSIIDWVIICFFIFLVLVPDSVDFLTFGLPILEGLAAVIYLVVRIASLRKKS